LSSLFQPFPKMARLSRDCYITEKIDGTNGQIYIHDGIMEVGSRNRWVTPQDDNYGFARWAEAHRDELMTLGEGRHFGEWCGLGIQRGYMAKTKQFLLFNVGRWSVEPTPACVGLVPTLYFGPFTTTIVDECLTNLREHGSRFSPGYMNPEGVIVYHVAAGMGFKKTFNDSPKGKSCL
jgi:hypothetical protein